MVTRDKDTFADFSQQIDGLEEILKDPVKQHYIISMLPARMSRQLLYKR